MTQIMLEVGSSDSRPIKGALAAALADVGYTAEVLPSDQTTPLIYSPTDARMDALFNQASAGEVSSVRFRTDGSDVAWALLFAPAFGPTRARPWTGVVELKHSRYGPLFEELLKQKDLDFVVVSQEETLDLNPLSITPTTFPWNDWRLVMAALPDGSGSGVKWMIRAGPARES